MSRRELAAALELASSRLRTAAAEIDRGRVSEAKNEITQAVAQVREVLQELTVAR